MSKDKVVKRNAKSMQQYALRRKKASNQEQSSQQCCKCHRLIPGTSRSLAAHLQFCTGVLDEKNDSSKKIQAKPKSFNASNIEKILASHRESLDYSYQYKQGSSYVKSLSAPLSLREKHLQKKAKHNMKSDDDSDIDVESLLSRSCYSSSDEENEHMDDDVFFDANDEIIFDMSDDESAHHSVFDSDDDGEIQTEDNESDQEQHIDDDNIELPFLYAQAQSLYLARKYSIPSDDIIKNTPKKFKYKETLSSTIVSLVELAHILSRHRCDKKLFDEITDWLGFWSEKEKNLFQSYGGSNRWTRERLLKRLRKVFEMDQYQPTIVKHKMKYDNRFIDLPVFDIAVQARSLLDDKDINNEDNIMKGLDRETLRPKRSPEEISNDPHALIDDKASGYLYGLACDLHCPRPDELNADDPKVLPLPLIFHIDKSHKSLKGDLAVTPVGMTLGQLDVDTIQKTDAWRMVAVVPNLKARQGSAKKSSTDDENRVKLQDQHDIFRVALSSLKEVYDQGGITWYNQKGELVILKPFVYMIIGDTVGNNELCKHFGGNNGQCLLKDCKCKLDNLVDTPTLCKPPTYEMLKGCDGNANKIFDTYEERGLISLRDLSDLNKNRQSEKAISYYDIRGFDDGLPLADPYQGIIGITPQELLHVTENGDMEYILLAHRNVIGKKAANAAVKEKINALFGDIKFFIEHNSERDIPRMANRFGFWNLTLLNAAEKHGNFFAYTVLMHTTYGQELIKPCFERQEINYDDVCVTMLLFLSWNRFVMDFNERYEYEVALHATHDMMARMLDHFPRPYIKKPKDSKEAEAGSHGWHIVKFHVLVYVLMNCLKFGSAKVCHGSAGEKNHKVFVKDMGELTQNRLAVFASQIAMNYSDYELLAFAWRNVQHHCLNSTKIHKYHMRKSIQEHQSYVSPDDDFDFQFNSNELDVSFERSETSVEPRFLRGEFNLFFKFDKRDRCEHSMKWKDPDKDCSIDAHPHVYYAIIKYFKDARTKLGIKSSKYTMQVQCFTEAKIRCTTSGYDDNVLFRCSPNYRDSEWYDFALIRMPKTLAMANGDTCVGKILCFIKYTNKGSLTFKHVEAQGLSKQSALDAHDDTLYVVVHLETKFTKHRYLEKKLIHRVSLQSKKDLYILPIGCIVGPLLVVPDILDEDRASDQDFLVCAAREKWGHYFRCYSNKLRSERENFAIDDEEDDCQDDSWLPYPITDKKKRYRQ